MWRFAEMVWRSATLQATGPAFRAVGQTDSGEISGTVRRSQIRLGRGVLCLSPHPLRAPSGSVQTARQPSPIWKVFLMASAKSWKSLQTVNAIEAFKCWDTRDGRLAAYAKTINAPVAEFVAWITKIGMGLKCKPNAIACHLHLMDLRKAARHPPCVLPRDVLRREAALGRAKALAAIMPEWPNPPLPEPTDWGLNGRHVLPTSHRKKHQPHRRHGSRRVSAGSSKYADVCDWP
jgi:hypothetical protein